MTAGESQSELSSLFGTTPQKDASVLVTAKWLEQHLEDPRVRVVDVRGKVLPPGNSPRYLAKRGDYDAAHIPGAAFVDWTRDFVDTSDPIPTQIAPPEAFAEQAARLGIGSDSLVVAYDDYNHIFASRLAWAFRYYGHDAVRVLDGGWMRWTHEGRPTSAEPPGGGDLTKRAGFTPRARPSLRRTAAEVQALLGRNDVLLLDARAPDQYSGQVSAARRRGHIPGARNVHYARLIDPRTGLFLAPSELAQVFREGGIDVQRLASNIVVYCNGGISCTVPLAALGILGRSDVAVYDGSWNEWGNDEKRPVRVGEQP